MVSPRNRLGTEFVPVVSIDAAARAVVPRFGSGDIDGLGVGDAVPAVVVCELAGARHACHALLHALVWQPEGVATCDGDIDSSDRLKSARTSVRVLMASFSRDPCGAMHQNRVKGAKGSVRPMALSDGRAHHLGAGRFIAGPLIAP